MFHLVTWRIIPTEIGSHRRTSEADDYRTSRKNASSISKQAISLHCVDSLRDKQPPSWSRDRRCTVTSEPADCCCWSLGMRTAAAAADVISGVVSDTVNSTYKCTAYIRACTNRFINHKYVRTYTNVGYLHTLPTLQASYLHTYNVTSKWLHRLVHKSKFSKILKPTNLVKIFLRWPIKLWSVTLTFEFDLNCVMMKNHAEHHSRS